MNQGALQGNTLIEWGFSTTQHTFKISLGILYQSDQNNHTVQLESNDGWEMGYHSKAACVQAGDQAP